MATDAVKQFLEPTQTEWGWSRWSTLERCAKEYELSYVHKIYPRETARALQLGSAMHRGLAAAYWRGMTQKRLVMYQPNFYRDVINAGKEPIEIKMEAVRLVHEHEMFWASRDEGFDRVIAVEQFAEIDLTPVDAPQSVPFTTRYDLVAMTGKQPVIVDHKSAASSRGDTALEWGLAGQFMGQIASWPKKGPQPIVLINKIIKTATVGFERVAIPFSASMIERWKKDMTALASDLARYHKNRYFPRKYSACQRRYGACAYAALCREGPSRAGDYYVPKAVNLDAALK